MKNKFFFVGLTLGLCLIQLSSCHKKLGVEDTEEAYGYKIPEIRDTIIEDRIIYFAGEKKLHDNKIPDPNKPKRRVLFRNARQMPLTESGVVKLYTEINEMGAVTYIETLPETTITSSTTLKKIMKAAFGYKYEANDTIPVQNGILTIRFDLSKPAGFPMHR